jgi:hypothetical protein
MRDEIENRLSVPLSLIPRPRNSSAVDRRGNDQSDAEHDRPDDNAERRIVIFFDLFMNVKDTAQNAVRNGEKDQTDKNEDQGRHQNFEQRVEFYDERQRGVQLKKGQKHLFSSTKTTGIDEGNSRYRTAPRIGKFPAHKRSDRI